MLYNYCCNVHKRYTAIIWWFYGETRGFNRGFDLIGMATMFYTVMPLSVVILISVLYTVYAIKNYAETKTVISIPVALVMSLILLASSVGITFHPTTRQGLPQDIIRSDTLRPTEGRTLHYQINFVNAFQRNARVELFVRDLTTQDHNCLPTHFLNSATINVMTTETINPIAVKAPKNNKNTGTP